MKALIQYQMQYAYDEPVSFSRHLFRLFPKTDRHLAIRHLNFQTNADAIVSYRRDLFDNEIASCFYPNKSSLLGATLQLEVEVTEKNAFGFLLESHALEMPFEYGPQELQVLSPYLKGDCALPLPFWKMAGSPRPTIAALVELNTAVHENIKYERRDEGPAREPAETLTLGSGACRDFAVLLAVTLRGLGLASRLASGYLCEFDESERRAEGALHAWTEVYLPGAGWLGLDPTNGVLCNQNHITTAVGLVPADVSPVLGSYFHPEHVAAQMSAALSIDETV